MPDSGGKQAKSANKRVAQNSTPGELDNLSPVQGSKGPSQTVWCKADTIAFAVVTVLSFVTRFYGIWYPDEVVFDEVHFGKFLSYYLQRTYFFDVHPPFAKLVLALGGWLIGYDGSFLFDNIGDSYEYHHVPYIGLRAIPASFGALTVPIVFLIMKESGYNLPAAVLASCLVLFDNARISEDRLILLDSILSFSMAMALYCYVKFSKQRHAPFSQEWFMWLLLTGTALSCTISTKYVGLFTFFTIGCAVAIDLWDLLDIKKGLRLSQVYKHFYARAMSLVVFPFLLYLLWFWIHFTVLNTSGPGNDFMTPEFQESLGDNKMTLESYPLNYYDTVTLRHKDTKVLLHSHLDRYPLRYEDGRISSQGQQVTGYSHPDPNNHWVIQPAVPLPEDQRVGRPLRSGDIIKLHHVSTDTDLLTHDVASPFYPTNQEFTTVTMEESYGARHNDTLFQIKVERANEGTPVRSKASHLKLVHWTSKVAMWTHPKPLPEWAYNQAEINGNKKIIDQSNVWYFDQIVDLEDEGRLNQQERQVKSIPFLKKYTELQRAMFYHNSQLTSEHPYASHPIEWPLLLRGVSFWTKNDTREQIYFVGNPIGWWAATGAIVIFFVMLVTDQMALRRGEDLLDRRTRSKLYNSVGFFLIAWAAHYFPFYLMGRQLFLHHYLPAQIAQSLVFGALSQFAFEMLFGHANNESQQPRSSTGRSKSNDTVSRAGSQDIELKQWAFVACYIAVLVGVFLFFAPFTYGTPGLSAEETLRRKWLPSYDMHFQK